MDQKIILGIQAGIMAAQTVILIFGLKSLKHMRKQEAMQSYIALSDRLFNQNLAELGNVELFASLDWDDDVYSSKNENIKRRIKHYLFMQFTMYEQMFCLQDLCKDDSRQSMQPWNKRFFRLVKKKRMSWYWKNDYMEQSCDDFKKFVEFCLEAKSHHELNEFFFNKRKPTFIAKYCPFSSVCNG